MASLYELTDKYRELWDIASNADSGEIDPDLESAIQENQDSILEKVDGYGKVIRHLEYDASMIEQEILRLKTRQLSCEKHAKRLKEALKFNMELLGEKSIKTALFTASLCNGPKYADIQDEAIIPFEFWEQQEPKLMRSKVADALKNGKQVPGATLGQRTNLRLT